MKIRLLLIAIMALSMNSVFAEDAAKRTDSLESRLQAIESQLTRIEALLRASVPASNRPDAALGQFRVTILGQVNLPGVYTVDSETSIAALIGLARGYTRIANQSQISVVSKSGEDLKVNAKKDPNGYKLKDGDIVTVSESYL